MAQKTQNSKLKFALFILVLLAVLSSGTLWLRSQQNHSTRPPANETIVKEAQTIPDNSIEKPQLPTSLLKQVPFTPQAPTANWDELHNEACEEASAIMAHAYFNQINALPASLVEQEITKLTEWQNNAFGYHLSITTRETAEMIESVYKLDTEIAPMTSETIKRALSENKLVILPANGRLLKNPNFKQPGPIYHMLVISGYTEQMFITNDPGTRKGANYQYSYETLSEANGTWEHENHEVNTTKKQIIIVSKK